MPNEYDVILQGQYTKLFDADVTATSITFPADTATEPTGEGVIDSTKIGDTVPQGVALRFYGTDAADETGTAVVVVWRQDANQVWKAQKIADIAITLGAKQGISAGVVTDSHYYADTLVISKDTGKNYTISPADDTTAMVGVDFQSGEKIQVLLSTDSSAAGLNGEFCFV